MKFFRFKDSNGVMRSWTAKKLYNRVMIDADASLYNWIASAAELVRVCKEVDFPEHYAKEIKLAILNNFAFLEMEGRGTAKSEPADVEAVHYCYNTLTSKEEEVVNAKRRYLRARIFRAPFFPIYDYRFHNVERKYIGFQERWLCKKLDELVSEKEIDFEQLMKDLEADLRQTIKRGEEEGAFKEYYKKAKPKEKARWIEISVKNPFSKN